MKGRGWRDTDKLILLESQKLAVSNTMRLDLLLSFALALLLITLCLRKIWPQHM